MIFRKSILVISAFVLAVSLYLVFRPMQITVPAKPALVPNTAHWLGGVDGGAWIACQVLSPSTVSCEFFADVTGVRVDKAIFVSPPKSKNLVVDDEFYDSLSYFDGERIRTNSGKFFVKTPPK